MEIGSTIQVKCNFRRAGFGHERVFLIDAPEGGTYKGVAYIKYCFQDDGTTQIQEGEPPLGQTTPGYVEARVVAISGDRLTVHVPDAELCDISQSLVKDFSDVLVG